MNSDVPLTSAGKVEALLEPVQTNVHGCIQRRPIRSRMFFGIEPNEGSDTWRDRCFLDLLAGYRRLGGLLRETHVVERFGGTEVAMYACRSAAVRLWWGDEYWVPVAQFKTGSLDVHPVLLAALSELQPALDTWEAARWLVSPNEWLGLYMPIELLDREPIAVVEAARADRYIATG